MSTLAEILRDERRKRGLTLDEAAVQAGISKSYLSDIERGRRGNPESVLNILNRVLQVYDLEARIVVGPKD